MNLFGLDKIELHSLRPYPDCNLEVVPQSPTVLVKYQSLYSLVNCIESAPIDCHSSDNL